MADDETFSADIDAVTRGGAQFQHVSDLVVDIQGFMAAIHRSKGNNLGGNGDLQKSFELNYDPSAIASLDFLDRLSKLIEAHGEDTGNLGAVFDATNTGSTEIAGNSGHRH
jgi:hypothetical protein